MKTSFLTIYSDFQKGTSPLTQTKKNLLIGNQLWHLVLVNHTARIVYITLHAPITSMQNFFFPGNIARHIYGEISNYEYIFQFPLLVVTAFYGNPMHPLTQSRKSEATHVFVNKPFAGLRTFHAIEVNFQTIRLLNYKTAFTGNVFCNIKPEMHGKWCSICRMWLIHPGISLGCAVIVNLLHAQFLTNFLLRLPDFHLCGLTDASCF